MEVPDYNRFGAGTTDPTISDANRGRLYQDETGQTTCKTCSIGNVVDAHATACTPCNAGTYGNDKNNAVPGTFSDYCTNCPSGQYQNNQASLNVTQLFKYEGGYGTPAEITFCVVRKLLL